MTACCQWPERFDTPYMGSVIVWGGVVGDEEVQTQMPDTLVTDYAPFPQMQCLVPSTQKITKGPGRKTDADTNPKDVQLFMPLDKYKEWSQKPIHGKVFQEFIDDYKLDVKAPQVEALHIGHLLNVIESVTCAFQ